MTESSEVVTIRRLPDGEAQPARLVNGSVHGNLNGNATRAAGRLSVLPLGEQSGGFKAGMLVEIDSPQALYLCEVVSGMSAGGQPDSLVTVAVEHFVDRAALAEIEKSWKTAEGA